MLRSLSIRDFVIVDRLDLEFQEGFTVLTGETGAGKSILIDALALVLGERSDPGLVREECARAEIGAEFSLERGAAGSRPGCETGDLAEETGVCVLRRVLEAGGRSRAYVNGRPATLCSSSRSWASCWSTSTASTSTSRCCVPLRQRELLDAYAGATPAGARGGASLARMAGAPAPARGVGEAMRRRWPPSASSCSGRCRSWSAWRSRPRSGTRCRPITAA